MIHGSISRKTLKNEHHRDPDLYIHFPLASALSTRIDLELRGAAQLITLCIAINSQHMKNGSPGFFKQTG